ncbi:efflux RND transporter periplasmic adaptor subunit [Vibrio hippocampi]|uniref:Multidrug resistance protein MdtA n=1 Tax=Vibrio hippocampi TaxID=654686 RepID=A0ABN8DGX0_9VIBR|nr:efflux RND transporter periplasmic adaptor subunit [Vibrio hippocampi]CAH0525873.1 Multidrug resistance protein MdtA [Vibrio hippocampi]
MNKPLLLCVILPCAIIATILPPFSHAVELIGKTISKNPLNVVSEVSGVIEKVHWQTGDIVTQGNRLATIKDQDFKLEVSKQQANLALMQADWDIKQSVYTRYQKLRSKKSLSQNELDIAKAEFSAAQANLSLAQIELKKAKLDLNNTQVDVAINGYVVERSVDNGTWVNQGDLLYKLTNIDQLNVRLLASEFDLQALAVGQPIQVWSEAQPTQRVNARINRIGVELDPVTFAYFVDVEINNEQHLFKPGMSIHATTEFESSGAEHVTIVQ